MSTGPAVGPVVEKTTRTRVIPAAEAARERTTPELWEFIENLTPQRWQDENFRLAIIREDPKPSTYGGMNTLEQCQGVIEVRPGVSVPLDDREDIQLAIKQKYGGRAYRLILKKGSERITEGKCINEAPPKYPDVNMQQFAGPLPNAGADSNSVAAKAIDAMAAQQPDAVRLAMDVLKTASEIVMKQGHAQTPAAPPVTDALDAELKRAMIARMLNPPDPFEMLIKFKELAQPPQNQVVDKILSVAVERLMNPVAAVSGRTTLLDLGREVIPAVVNSAKDAIHEWRLGVEAQVRGVELSRGMNPQPAQQPAPQAAAAIPPSAEQQSPDAQPGGPQPPSGDPPFDWLAMKIVEILKEPDFTVERAADETLAFLYRSHVGVVALLLDPPKLDPRLKPGEEGLLQLFQYHSILKQVPVNPRLAEFIKKFVAMAKEAELERTKNGGAAATPANPPSA